MGGKGSGRKRRYHDDYHTKVRERMRELRGLKKVKNEHTSLSDLAPVASKAHKSLVDVEMDLQNLQLRINEREAAKANLLNEFAASVKGIVAEMVGRDSEKYIAMMEALQEAVDGLREQFRPRRDPELVELEKRVLQKLESYLDRFKE